MKATYSNVSLCLSQTKIKLILTAMLVRKPDHTRSETMEVGSRVSRNEVDSFDHLGVGHWPLAHRLHFLELSKVTLLLLQLVDVGHQLLLAAHVVLHLGHLLLKGFDDLPGLLNLAPHLLLVIRVEHRVQLLLRRDRRELELALLLVRRVDLKNDSYDDVEDHVDADNQEDDEESADSDWTEFRRVGCSHVDHNPPIAEDHFDEERDHCRGPVVEVDQVVVGATDTILVKDFVGQLSSEHPAAEDCELVVDDVDEE